MSGAAGSGAVLVVAAGLAVLPGGPAAIDTQSMDAATLVVATPGAVSATPQVEVSLDARTWSSTLARPLFDPGVRWVPGDTRTASFYFRSTANAPRAWIELVVDSQDQRGANWDVDVAVQTDRVGWKVLPGSGEAQPIGSAAKDQVVPVTVRASMGSAAPNPTQLKSVDLQFTVLAEGADNPAPPWAPPAGGGRGLAHTGLDGAGQLAGWALVLLAVGALVGAMARRRGQDDG